MAISTSNSSDEMITDINVTPLVDVVLVLLVIFMLTAPLIYQATIKVDLPKAASGEKTEHITLRFTLLKDGSVALGNERVSRDQVNEIVKRAIKQDPTANAVVAADTALSHGDFVSFVDQLKSNGITRFAIGVDSPQGQKNEKRK